MSGAGTGPPVLSGTLPYPGLRSFSQDESRLFFGRDDEIDAMVDRFFEHRFLAVLGASGSGKSSLVRAGLLPVLQSGTTAYGSNWLVADLSPGGQPMAELANALLRARAGDPDFAARRRAEGLGVEPTDAERTMLQARLGWGPRAISEWAEEGGVPPGWRLLVLVDQFEELFNYKSLAGREDAQAFAALLPGAVDRLDDADHEPAVEYLEEPAGRELKAFATEDLAELAPTDHRVFVVLTMRSDYFGFCSAHPELAQAIGDSSFLTPRVLRDQCYEAIVGPADLLGFEVKKDLINQLLNDMELIAPFVAGKASGSDATDRQADQLPLMQFVLNRMWQHAVDTRGPTSLTLTVNDYDQVGKLEGAFGKAGERAILHGKLDIGVVERVFRALVYGPSVERAVRDPRSVSKIGELTGLSQDQIIAVVKAFSAPDIQFLRVKRLPLGPDSIVDITHEAIIRQWALLKDWLKVEAQWADSWRRLAESAVDWLDPDLRNQDDKERAQTEALIGGLALERRREWLATAAPTPYWTERYPVFRRDRERLVTLDEAEAFVATSAEQERARIRKAQQAKVRRRVFSTAGFAAAILVALFSLFEILNQRARVQQQINVERSSADRRLADANRRLGEIDRRANNTARIAINTARLAATAEREALKNKNEAEAAAAKALAATRTAERERASAYIAIGEAIKLAAKQQDDLETNAAGVSVDQALASESAGQQMQTLERVRALSSLPPEAAAQFTDLTRRAMWLQAEALFQAVGSSSAIGRERKTSPRLVAAKLEQIAKDETEHRTPLDVVRADFVGGRAAELRGQFDGAAAAYTRAWTASKPGGSAPNAALAYRSAAALVGLHRFIDPATSATAAGWCKEPPPSSVDPDGRLASQGCRIEVANMDADKEDTEEAKAVLAGVEAELAAQGAAAGSGSTPASSFEQVRVRISAQVARARLGAIGDDVDAELVLLARQRLLSNPDTEAASDLLSQVLEANEAEALETRRAALNWSEASTRYLLKTVPLVENLVRPENSAVVLGAGSRVISGSARKAVDDADHTMLAWQLYDTLHSRGAPLPVRDQPGNAAPWLRRRDELTESVTYRFGAAAEAIRRDAGSNGVLADVKASPLTYLTEGDRRQLEESRSEQARLAAACTGQGADHCSTIVADLRREMTIPPAFDLPKGRAASQQSRTGAIASSEPWLAGHDLVTYQSEDGPHRGRTDISYPYGGKTLLFVDEANRELFERTPERYLPAYGGAAPEWLKSNTALAGSPRIFCRTSNGRALTLFNTEEERNKVCGEAGMTGEGRALLAAADLAWKGLGNAAPVLANQKLVAREPVVDAKTEDRMSGRTYRITTQTPITPIGGRAVVSRAGPLVITHPDGSESNFYLAGGTWDWPDARDLKAGDPLPIKDREESMLMLWTYEAPPDANGVRKSVPIADLLRSE